MQEALKPVVVKEIDNFKNKLKRKILLMKTVDIESL